MVAIRTRPELDAEAEAFVARLTRAAYDEVLRHGISGPFAELELAIWQQLREVVREATPDAPALIASQPGEAP